jgi:hypothetical protein
MTTQLVYVTMYFEDDHMAGDSLGVFTSRDAAKAAGDAHFAGFHPGRPTWTDDADRSEALHRGARYLVREMEIMSR